MLTDEERKRIEEIRARMITEQALDYALRGGQRLSATEYVRTLDERMSIRACFGEDVDFLLGIIKRLCEQREQPF